MFLSVFSIYVVYVYLSNQTHSTYERASRAFKPSVFRHSIIEFNLSLCLENNEHITSVAKFLDLEDRKVFDRKRRRSRNTLL